jgi:excinuclease UvrABC ATPase subunit
VRIVKDVVAHMTDAHSAECWPQGMSGEDERFARGYVCAYVVRQSAYAPLTDEAAIEYFAERLGGKSPRLREAFERGMQAAFAEEQAEQQRLAEVRAERDREAQERLAETEVHLTTIGEIRERRMAEMEALDHCPGCMGEGDHRPSCVQSVLQALREAVASDGIEARKGLLQVAMQAMVDHDRWTAEREARI